MTATLAPVTVGQRISARRRQLGVTRSELAAAMSVRVEDVDSFEHGRALLDITEVADAAHRLGVPTGTLLGVGDPSARGYSSRENGYFASKVN